jgi:hypothetical protein
MGNQNRVTVQQKHKGERIRPQQKILIYKIDWRFYDS